MCVILSGHYRCWAQWGGGISCDRLITLAPPAHSHDRYNYSILDTGASLDLTNYQCIGFRLHHACVHIFRSDRISSVYIVSK